MKWRRGVGGGQVEDRRGMGLPIGVGGGGLGIVGLLIAILLGGGVIGGGGSDEGAAPSDEVEFVRFVVDDVQASWETEFRAQSRNYEPTQLVLFSQATSTGCGLASSQTGPFYCPRDRKVYLDLGFFRELRSRFGAPGDFAQAYVIAHEFGHHVQNQLGVMDQVHERQQNEPGNANFLSVDLELQADCLAGVWGKSAADEGLLEPGDLEEGLRAAAAVGDDRLQRQAGQQVNRETWTHGSSEQRVQWFRRGFETGDPGQCNTFA